MGGAVVERVKQDAASVVQNLPDAHASWQLWRNARFRAAVGRIDASIYSIDAERYTETQLELLREAALLVSSAVRIHTSSLGAGVRDEVDRQFYRQVTERLKEAADCFERGESPNPDKRPSDDTRLERFGEGLRRANLA